MILNSTYNHPEVYYQSIGEGPVLYLMHGFCSDSRIWKQLTPLLKDDYTLIMPDLPGYGKSKLPNEKLSIEIIADAIEGIIEKEKHKDISILGHSMGGYVLCELLSRKNKNIRRGIMLHSHPYADNKEKIAHRQKGNAFIRKHGYPVFVKELYKNLYAPVNLENTPEPDLKFKDIISDLTDETIVQSNEAMIARQDHSKTLEDSGIPIQFIIGENDQLIDLNTSLSQSYLPAVSDVQIMENTGHLGMVEHPEKLAKLIKDFLKLEL